MAFLFSLISITRFLLAIFAYMVIYGIDGNKILDAILTESAEHEQELSKSDFVKLSWEGVVKTTIPSGSYIVPFEDGLKYRLLNAYTPSETDKGFRYDISFHHPLMWLSRVPFLYVENDLKQQEWSFEGLTVTALEYVCKAINEAFNITDDAQKFTYTICGTVDGSVSFSVSSNDILSVLSSIAQACKDNNCEWHISWEHRALYFGQIAINLGEEVPVLKVHDNLQTASVSESKEDYYNCFYPQGSTKNMSRKAQVGTGNVATLARLGLDTTKYPDSCIYIGTDGNVITKAQFEASNAIKQTLALSFDDIYPHIDLYAYNIRKRTRYLKNDTTGEYELDSKGNKKIYTVWYMRLAYCTTIKNETTASVNITTDNDEQGNIITHYWYDYDLDVKKQVLQGYTLKGTFKVNIHTTNNQYDALTQSLVGQPSGQDGFELYYHENNETLPASEPTGDSGISVLKGDYEIKMYQSGDTIIPTNEEDGLIPHGNELPDLTCNIVVLFNIVMGEYETKLAQEELAARTVKEIARRTRDNNNYISRSNAVAFEKNNPNLYIGQKVIYDDGFGYNLSTRVIKLVTKLDYPIIQEITVGNQAIKGTISQLKEDVNNILSGNFSGSGLNSEQIANIIRNYTTPRFLSKISPDTAQALITFLKGIKVGDRYGIDKLGKAIFSSLNLSQASIDEHGIARVVSVIASLLQSPDFDTTEESGFGITRRKDGKYQLSITDLVVWGKAVFNELEIRRMYYSGGNRTASAAGSRIIKVVPVTADGKEIKISKQTTVPFLVGGNIINANGGILSETREVTEMYTEENTFETLTVGGNFILANGGYLSHHSYNKIPVTENDIKAYRCYFFMDDGTTATMNGWRVDDQAFCQTFNIKEGVYENVSNSRYWRRVVNIGGDYIDLSKEDCEENSSIPQAGDVVVLRGNRTLTDRQSMIEELTNGDDAPAYVMYDGINSYSLKNKRTAIISPKLVEISSRIFRLITTSGESTPMVVDRGEWESGKPYGYYDRVSHLGSLWLCIIPIGETTTEEPSESATYWRKQVSKGDAGKEGKRLVITDTVDYGKSLSGTIIPTAWVGDVQDLNLKPGDYLWTRTTTAYNYDDGSSAGENSVSYSISRIGSDGADGTSIKIKGHVATPSQLPLSENTAGDAYVVDETGHLFVWTKDTPNGDFTDWADVGQFKGADGEDGWSMHVAWAKSATFNSQGECTGVTGFTTSNVVGDVYWYIGTYRDKNASDSNNWADYKWKKYRGDDGTSIDIVSKSVQYQTSSSGTVVPTGAWSNVIVAPTDTMPFLWTRTIVNYSDGTNTTAYSVSYKGKDGEKGDTGAEPVHITLSPESVLIEQSITDGQIGLANAFTTVSVLRAGLSIPHTIQILSASHCNATKSGDNIQITKIHSYLTDDGTSVFYDNGNVIIEVTARTVVKRLRFSWYCNMVGTWKTQILGDVETSVAELKQFLDEEGEWEKFKATYTRSSQEFENRLTAEESRHGCNLIPNSCTGIGWTGYTAFEPKSATFTFSSGNLLSPEVTLPKPLSRNDVVILSFSLDTDNPTDTFNAGIKVGNSYQAMRIGAFHRYPKYDKPGKYRYYMGFVRDDGVEKLQVVFRTANNVHNISQIQLEYSADANYGGDTPSEYEYNIGLSVSESLIKQTADSIRLAVQETGINIVDKYIDLTAARFKITDGMTTTLVEGGKIKTDLLDAKKIVVEGIKAQTIDAQNATFTNLTVNGKIEANEGWFGSKTEGLSIGKPESLDPAAISDMVRGIVSKKTMGGKTRIISLSPYTFDAGGYAGTNTGKGESLRIGAETISVGTALQNVSADGMMRVIQKKEVTDINTSFYGINVCAPLIGSSNIGWDSDPLSGRHAILITDGRILGARFRMRRTSQSMILSPFDFSIVTYQSGNLTLTIPKGCEDGQEFHIRNLGIGTITVALQSGTPSGTVIRKINSLTSAATDTISSGGVGIYKYDAIFKAWIAFL